MVGKVDGIWLSILGTAEGSITIMAASIPILRALIRHVAPRMPPAAPTSFYNGNSPAFRLDHQNSDGWKHDDNDNGDGSSRDKDLETASVSQTTRLSKEFLP